MDAARDQVIARAFGRRAREHGRFDFEEAEFVERLANFEDDAVPQLDIAMRARAAQVEVAVAQARLFARASLRLRSETAASSSCSGCAARVAITSTSPVAMSGIRLSAAAPRGPSTATTNSERSSSALACASAFSSLLKTICAMSGAVAQVDEDQLAEVAPPVHPAHQHDVLSASDARSAPQ